MKGTKMPRRRKRSNFLDEDDNHERWLVSYADFVTLLFAFFVLMYSVSSVNNIEYENLSEVLEEAFTHKKNEKTVETKVEIQPEDSESVATTIEPIVLDNPVIEKKEEKEEKEQEEKEEQEEEKEEKQDKKDLSEEILKERRLLQQISENFEEVLQPYIEKDLVKVIRNDFWIELEMNSELLFVSGEAAFSDRALPILEKIAELVRRMPNIINVEGHTDNMPIDTMRFSSNWELSSARATSVVREFVNYGISPKRLAAIGYGEHHPVAENEGEESRKKNRRVVLVLMSRAFARYGMNDEERANLLNFNRSVKESPAL